MKRQRWMALCLAAALGMGLAAPAGAAEGADARLAQVTRTVKGTLGIGDEYGEFYGEPSEGPLGTRWQLTWSGERELRVTATEAGKVVDYYRETEPVVRRDRFTPAFPATTPEAARETAKTFLERVLSEGEEAVLEEGRESAAPLGAEEYGLGGTILLDELPTPMRFWVRVNCADGQVSRFWRNDETDYAGSAEKAGTAVTREAAREALKGTLDLELIYVRDGERAVTRYVPRSTHTYYVDAGTGKLVDLTALRESLYRSGVAEAGGAVTDKADAAVPESAPVPEPSLSPEELAGIAKLEGVLSQEELDGAVRKWTALKLEGFTLSSCSYSVEREEKTDEKPAVTAQLVYLRRSEDGTARRRVTADARTGALLRMNGYNGGVESGTQITQAAARRTAEAFLKELWGEEFDKTALYERECYAAGEDGGAHRFAFAQQENGIFFPENILRVSISASDGAVMSFGKSFDAAISFESAEGLISAEEAERIWADSFAVKLRYVAVPAGTETLGKDLTEQGYFECLKAGYTLDEQEKNWLGVEAKTGSLVRPEEDRQAEMTYGDLTGHWARKALEELAEYRVGWLGGEARPNEGLTQLELVALLCSADGYLYDPETGSADDMYRYAASLGMLTLEEREDDRLLTRGEMVKLLLDSLGYREVANLPDIFRCGYADAASIPAELLGYAALAQALGMVKGDAAGRFAPERAATRAEAAVMLWQYMKR